MKPGVCALTEEWQELLLIEKIKISPNSYLFSFKLPKNKEGREQALKLSTCACVLALPSGGKMVRTNRGKYSRYEAPICPIDGEPYPPRPYTPISTNLLIGKFELMVKIYPTGKFTPWLDSIMPGKGTVMFSHIEPNVKIQYPFGKQEKIGMLVGGTGKSLGGILEFTACLVFYIGITPMIQVMHSVLGNSEETRTVSMLYGSRTEDDILAKPLLDDWLLFDGERLSITYTLSIEPKTSKWKGRRGFVDSKLVQQRILLEDFPSPEDNCIIFVCGVSVDSYSSIQHKSIYIKLVSLVFLSFYYQSF